MDEASMGEHDVFLILPNDPRKATLSLSEFRTIACEYETFWAEGGRIFWKLYSDAGVVVIQMKIEPFMEAMLGDEVMSKFFNVSVTKE